MEFLEKNWPYIFIVLGSLLLIYAFVDIYIKKEKKIES